MDSEKLKEAKEVTLESDIADTELLVILNPEQTPTKLELWLPYPAYSQVYILSADRSHELPGRHIFVGYIVQLRPLKDGKDDGANLIGYFELEGTDEMLSCDLSFTYPTRELLQKALLIEVQLNSLGDSANANKH